MAEGVASIYKNNNGSGGNSSPQEGSFYARVMYTLLEDSTDKLKEMDIPAGTVGAIQCQVIHNGVVNESTPPIVALPHNSFLKRFPIKNEVVEIIAAITPKSNNPKDNNLRKYYYKDVLNVWDTAEHNAIPDQSNSTQPTGDFKETGKVSKLKHQSGDFTIEGRFGNTIRLGTSKVKGTAPWEGEDNKPVTIIRNGQIDNNANLFEDVNKDGSSFYMLSGQSLPFIPANLNFESYNQKVSATDKSKVVTSILTQAIEPTASLQQELPPTPIKDEPAVVYTTPVNIANTAPVEDEIEFLPDNENEFTQIFEDTGPRHVEEDNSNWVNNINNTSISETNFSLVNIGSLDRYLVAYLQHQQGEAGLKAILNSANKGLSRVPTPNKFTSADINYNMFGKRISPGRKSSGNVGDDFVKYFGTNYTPTNFLKYWIPKFKKKLIESNKKTKFDDLFITYGKKYNVPVDFIKNVCQTESSFNPNDGNAEYKGLFAIGIKEFQSVYPGDSDIFNPEKNTNVGVQLLARKLARVPILLNSIK